MLAIAAAQGGAAASSLEELAARPETPLPLDELSAAIPFSSLRLYQLALVVDQRRLDAARTVGAEPAKLAELLLRVSARAGNAGDQVAESGDRAGALASITEAVAICRELAGVNPAAFLPNLATSLNDLSRCQSETGHADAVAPAWHAAIDAMALPAARAELRAAWARRLSASEHPEQAWDQLCEAAAEADLPAAGHGPPDRTSVILMSRARIAIRSVVEDLGPMAVADGLPVWASEPIPDAHLDLVNAYGEADDWPATQATLDGYRESLTFPEFRTAVHVLVGPPPRQPCPGQPPAVCSMRSTNTALRRSSSGAAAITTAAPCSPRGSTRRPGRSPSTSP